MQTIVERCGFRSISCTVETGTCILGLTDLLLAAVKN